MFGKCYVLYSMAENDTQYFEQNDLSAFEHNDDNNKENISEVQAYITPNDGKSDNGGREKGINIQQAFVTCPEMGQEYALPHQAFQQFCGVDIQR